MVINLSIPEVEKTIKHIAKYFRFRKLENSQIEQVAYRVYLCESCLKVGKCRHCGCDVYDVLIEPLACNNGEIFPDFMSEKKWEKFKNEKSITIQQ